MISQIPSLQTNVIATVRREAQPAVADSGAPQQNASKREDSFQLNMNAAKETPAVNNDNFADAGINLAAVNDSYAAPIGKNIRNYANQAYAVAESMTAFTPYRSVSFSI